MPVREAPYRQPQGICGPEGCPGVGGLYDSTCDTSNSRGDTGCTRPVRRKPARASDQAVAPSCCASPTCVNRTMTLHKVILYVHLCIGLTAALFLLLLGLTG